MYTDLPSYHTHAKRHTPHTHTERKKGREEGRKEGRRNNEGIRRKEGRREEGRKGGRKEERKKGRKEGRYKVKVCMIKRRERATRRTREGDEIIQNPNKLADTDSFPTLIFVICRLHPLHQRTQYTVPTSWL